MKLTEVLERIGMPHKPASSLVDSDYSLSVAVVYQNTLTQKWARQVCARARRLIGDEGRMAFCHWGINE
jgi:hypothetical protein